jgi:DNA-binding PadR family transcriptional regulator
MSEARLREFEELVLLAVLMAGDEAYGAALQEILAEEAHRDVSLGAIYTALDRLEKKGFVRSEMGEPTPVRGGRRRREYRLTPEGLEHVREARRIRNRMWEQVEPEFLEGDTGR